MTGPKLTAHDLTTMLRAHYLPENRPASGAFVQEIEAPSGRRRADALWVPLTRAGGTGIIGHEVKVSRADVLAELSDPTKAEDWSKYCTRWWLTVSDPSLVDGLDIPEAWGIMAPPSGRLRRSMTVLRPAPKLTPDDPAAAFRRVLSVVHFRERDEISRLKHEATYHEQQIERLKREVQEARVASSGQYATPETKRAHRIVTEVGNSQLEQDNPWFRIENSRTVLSDQDYIDALIDLARTRHAAQAVQRDLDVLIRSAKEVADPFKRSAAILERLTVPAHDPAKEKASA